MEVEVCVDLAALRRRRAALAFLLAAVLYLPALCLASALIARLLGREAAERHAGALALASFAAVMAVAMYGARDRLLYRCPLCRRRPYRVIPQGAAEPNICFQCAECRVVWDLGWGWGSPA